MKKKKLNLDELEVQSFVTNLNEKEKFNAGGSFPCPSLSPTYCEACPTVNCSQWCTDTCDSNPCCDTYYTCGCGGTTGGGCFLAGTLVNIGNNKYIEIQNLKLGDEVLSFDEKNKSLGISKVERVFKTDQPFYYKLNNLIHTTATHPFYVNNKWIEVKDIKIGDELMDETGKKIKISTIEKINEQTTVYNLTVSDVHTFFVHDMLVHNKLDTGTTCGGGD